MVENNVRINLALCLSVFVAAAQEARCAEDNPRFTSGQYEQLMLAVDAAGKVTGYYREEQGESVVKACAFYLAGKGPDGEVPVVVWNKDAFPGMLKPLKDGVRLTIARGREITGCGLVLLPQIAQGIDLDRVESADWFELRRISSAHARLQPGPDAGRVLPAVLARGDIVGVLAKKDLWLKVEYRRTKVSTVGWIPAKDTEELIPPERQKSTN